METSCLFVIFGSLLSLSTVRVLGAPTVAPNLAEDIAILKNKVSNKGSNVAEQLAKSPKKTKTKTIADDFDDEYLTSAMLEFGDMDRDGLLNFDEIFRFYLAVVRFPLKKASDTAQSFLDLGDINKDGKLSIKELLKIMDEAEHLAEFRALLKTGGSKETGGGGNGGKGEGNKAKDQKPLPAEGSVSQHEGDKDDHKPSPSEEGNVEELHNLQIAMK